MSTNTAYSDGYLAQNNDIPLTDCPYEDEADIKAWEDGWMEAEAEALANEE